MLHIRASVGAGCTLATCSASESIYGYRPDLAATIVFLTIFFATAVVYGIQNRLRRCWFFTVVMILGSISETLGYVAKLLLYQNPFSDAGFKMNVVLLTFAPAFYSAGIYYTFRHICYAANPSLSRLPPTWYTYIFITADVVSIAFQAVGGAINSVADAMTPLFIAGDNLLITGLVTQVFTLVVFASLVVDYGLRVRRDHKRRTVADGGRDDPSKTGGTWSTALAHTSRRSRMTAREKTRLGRFLVALTVAFLCILVRCAYRVAELAKGWVNNPILTNQYLFIFLDSLPCAIAAILLNICHPAWCLPTMVSTGTAVTEPVRRPDAASKGDMSDDMCAVEEARLARVISQPRSTF